MLVVFGFVVYWLWGVLKPDKYIGFYYPDAGNLLDYEQSYELGSLEECREWVDDVSNGRTDTGFDYECGKNCKLSEDYQYLLKNDPGKLRQYNLQPSYVCEETLE